MRISDFKIGIRLGIGFGAVLILAILLIVLASLRLSNIAALNTSMADGDWPKADAASRVSMLIRANGRDTLELLAFDAPAARARASSNIEDNKARINDLVQKLDAMVARPEAKAMLARFKEARGHFVESYTQVANLVNAGKLDDARSLAMNETMPRLDAATKIIADLQDLQGDQLTRSGQTIEQTIFSVRAQMLIVGAVAVLIGVAFAVWVTHSITRPINSAVQVAVTVARGDLTTQIQVNSKDETGLLLAALRDMSESLRKLVGGVRSGSETIATATGQIAAGNTDVSARTEEQAASLEETASSMEELTATVRQNVESARQGNMLAKKASEVATRSGEVVGRVVHTMREISDSSAKVADIITTIESIAFQTNILALNAAVEAARAGDQGKGFAVVASEVRTLAQRSASAAKEIKELIDMSVNRVQAGEAQVSEAGSTIVEVVSAVRRVTDLMGEISAASEEQHQGIEQVNQAVVQMDQVTQQNAALVEQAAAAAQSLQEQASQLVTQVGVFKLVA